MKDSLSPPRSVPPCALRPQCSSAPLQPPCLAFDASPVKAVRILEANWVYGSYFAWVKIAKQSVNEPERQSVFDIIKGIEILGEESVRGTCQLSALRGFDSILFCLISSIISFHLLFVVYLFAAVVIWAASEIRGYICSRHYHLLSYDTCLAQ